MNWLPTPTDLRRSLRTSQALSDPLARRAEFAKLAHFALSYIETIQLDNAIQKSLLEAPAAASEDLQPIKLALLASCTVDHLLPALRVAGLRYGLLIDTYLGKYGQYRQELLSPESGLYGFDPDFVLLSRTASEALAKIPLSASAGQAASAVSGVLAEQRQLWDTARQAFRATVIQQTFLDVTPALFGGLDRVVPGAPASLIARLNDQLVDAASNDLLLLDVARASARDGIDAWFDVTRWLQGKLEIAPQAAAGYGEMVARLIAAQRGRSRKCLVLDLDNTLWGGVIGDDGLEGIVIGEGNALGEAHLALQRYAKALKERGIVLAVCSKNEPEIAASVFEQHPEMLLQRSDFAAFVANWTDKASNLRTIAESLNLGLDSLVFIDDNPAERARVRASLPQVAVPELPADPAHYVRCIADAGYFEAVSFTSEDSERANHYAANAEREAVRSAAQSLDEYLSGLEMTVSYGPVGPVDLARSTQLINKTNQFNTTTRRYSTEEFAALAAAPNCIALQFRLVDRFGDNGLVSLILLSELDSEPGTHIIVNWVMSCRVFGRQLEYEAMNIAAEYASKAGASRLRADYIPTAKNGVIRDLFEKLGFSAATTHDSDGNVTSWELDLSQYTAHSTHITRKA
jgi:FkbH-like protein